MDINIFFYLPERIKQYLFIKKPVKNHVVHVANEMRCLFYGAPASELPKAARGRSTGSTNWEPFSRRARLQMRYTDGGVWMMMMMMGDLNDE